MSLRVLVGGVAIAAMIVVTPVRAQEAPAPVITFETDSVVVSGVVPGSRIVWTMEAKEVYDQFLTVVTDRGVLVDDDLDGAVRIQRNSTRPNDPNVPEWSIWGVVDLEDGAFATAASPTRLASGRSTLLDLPPWPVQSDFDPLVDVVPLPGAGGAIYQAVLVRPAVGGWGVVAGDGGANDRDGSGDGLVHLDLSHGISLTDSSAAPPRAQAGDVLLVLEGHALDGFAARSDVVWRDGFELGDLNRWAQTEPTGPP